MKVKLFWKKDPLAERGFGWCWSSDKHARALEGEINTWLGENPSIRIVETRQTANGGSLGPGVWLISVWYDEGAA